MINVLHPDIMATSDQDPNLVEPVSGELADKNVIRSVLLDIILDIILCYYSLN